MMTKYVSFYEKERFAMHHYVYRKKNMKSKMISILKNEKMNSNRVLTLVQGLENEL